MVGPRLLLTLEDLDGRSHGVDLPAGVFDRRWHCRLSDRHTGTGRVDEADGLVGELSAGEIAARKLHALHHRFVEDRDVVILLQRVDDAANHADCHLVRRFLYLDHLKSPGERRILLEVLLVFRPGGGRDRAEFAAGQGRLEHVGRVALSGLTASADERVGLVDEEDDRHGRFLHLVDHPLEPVLEFPLHACARLQQAEIERAERHLLERLGYVASGDPLRKTLDDGRLTHARLAGEDRVVLTPTHEDVDDLPHLRLAAEHGVDLARLRPGGEVDRVLVEIGGRRRALRLAVGARRSAALRGGGIRAGKIRLDRPLKHAGGLAGQHVGGDLPQFVGGGQRPWGDRFLGEQGLENPGAADLVFGMIHAGYEPRLPRQHAHLGGEERRPRVARLEPVDRLGEVAEQFCLIDVKEFQQQADVVARLLEEFDEPVLDLNVVVGL